ncbi:hypothetical protein AXA44_02785 [Rhodococcus sp. SC4]|nr:hypothetical protein AXA44_02785 [Rhodococcus sp. SC4]
MSTDIAADIFRAERERRCNKAQEHLDSIIWAAPRSVRETIGRLRALIDLLRDDMSTAPSVDLRDVARGLDQVAVDAIQSGDLVKAREAVALAITLDDRQRQLEAGDFR